MELVLSKKIIIMELVGRQLMCLLWRGSLRQNLREEKTFERKMNFSFKKNLRKTITRISIR